MAYSGIYKLFYISLNLSENSPSYKSKQILIKVD